MAYFCTEPASERRNVTGKNRVWDFFRLSNETHPANRRQPLQPRRKIRPTAMKSASGIPYWPSRDPIEEEGGLNLYGFVYNDSFVWIDYLGREPIKPSVQNGWTLDDDHRWEKAADAFRRDDMTDAERKIGDKTMPDGGKRRKWYDFGCKGVTHCLLEKTTVTHTQCYLSEPRAVDEAAKLDCSKTKGEKGSVFAIRYWDKHKASRKERKDGTYPVISSEVESGNPDFDTPFDFGYRQSDGSFIHADHSAPDMTVKISPSAKEFDKDYGGFNTTVYCVRCSPCTR